MIQGKDANFAALEAILSKAMGFETVINISQKTDGTAIFQAYSEHDYYAWYSSNYPELQYSTSPILAAYLFMFNYKFYETQSLFGI